MRIYFKHVRKLVFADFRLKSGLGGVNIFLVNLDIIVPMASPIKFHCPYFSRLNDLNLLYLIKTKKS